MGEAVADATVVNGSFVVDFRLENGQQLRAFKADLRGITGASDLPPLKNPDFMDQVNDLSLLSYLHEPAVFWGIKNRFMSGDIYTYSGMVLIAMNPFQHVDLYSVDIMRDYVGKKRDDLVPHIYGIAEECYKAMLNGQNQSVIVSGESGAGKTQSTKYIMQYLAVVDTLSKQNSVEALMRPESFGKNIQRSETEEAVLASNPILESFGNAKTTRNDNSSRFGKFVELFFSSPYSSNVRITGAKIRTYLLERSRLIFQPATERNYHIFYQLCAAVPAAERKQLGLDKWESFHYLNQGNAGIVRNINDVEEFKATQNAFSTLGMSVSIQWEIFKICAAILHIGNTKITDNGNEGSSISLEDPAIILATDLLGINKFEFVKWISHKQTGFKEKILKPLNVKSSLVSRDSVTKVIYTKLFDWLVLAINKNLMRESTDSQNFIGVLDIYGFEHFAVNSFEQFCINYANEKLQQEFNAHVFRNEQEGYVQEGIVWKMIDFVDNMECIELIEGKKSGPKLSILSLLDEESRLQNEKADANFVTKLVANFEKHNYYVKPRFGNTDFTVRHYAVDVTYNSAGFVEKNKDSMSEELQEVLANSNNVFLKDILQVTVEREQKSEETSIMNRRSTQSAPKKPTLGSMFKESLEDLMTTIRATEGHYIRCIKPNMAKKAFEFEGAMVLGQLKACGVLETIKISNAGYPNKLSYADFSSRYNVLVKSDSWGMDDKKQLCEMIVKQVLQDSTKYQFGKTKVFLKSGQIAFFEDRRKDRIQHFVSFLTKNTRRFIARRKFLRMKYSAVILQSAFRGLIVRKEVSEEIEREQQAKAQREQELLEFVSATKIQAAFRGSYVRNQYCHDRALVVILQSAVRTKASKKILASLKAEAKNVERVKEKAFSLESKVVELSQSIREKDLEVKRLSERCMTYESQIASWKEKFDLLEAKHKAATAEILSLQEQFANVSTNIEDGVHTEQGRASPSQIAIVGNEQSDRSSSGAPSMERNRSFGQRPAPPKKLGSFMVHTDRPAITRSSTVNEKLLSAPSKSPDSRGRTFGNKIPEMRFSVSPSGDIPAVPAPTIPFPGQRNVPVRIGSVLAKSDEVASLRFEVENLKNQLAACKCKANISQSQNDNQQQNGKPPIGRPTRTPTMRAKSIFEQSIVDDAELARKHQLATNQKSGTTGTIALDSTHSEPNQVLQKPPDFSGSFAVPDQYQSSVGAKINRRTSSVVRPPRITMSIVKSFIQVERESILRREDFNTVICECLVVHATAPTLDHALSFPKETLYPASLLSSVFAMLLELGVLVQLHELYHTVIKSITDVVKQSQEANKTAFWISNVYQILCNMAFVLDREMKVDNNRAVTNMVQSLQRDFGSLFEKDLVPMFLMRLRDQAAEMGVRGILDNQDLPGMKVDSSGGLLSIFGFSNESRPNGLLELEGFISGISSILRGFMIPDLLHGRILSEIFRTIGVVTFNGLLIRRNFLGYKRALQIQFNLTQLEEWLKKNGMNSGLIHLQKVSQASLVLTYSKSDAFDANIVCRSATQLNPTQLFRLFSHYPSRDIDSPMTAEFLEVLKQNSDTSSYRDTVTLSMDPEPEYPPQTILQADGLHILCPPGLAMPTDFGALFRESP
ncbi:Myosin type-2 heavy chain 1 [Entophlyctis luteolus]|nr:Myosin type-2 heavy chain 1 [Entophlyctis luteolus]